MKHPYIISILLLILCFSCEEKKTHRDLDMDEYMQQFIKEKVVIDSDTFTIVDYATRSETFDLYRNSKVITVDWMMVVSQIKKPTTRKI